jgi:hypothetical protein
MSCFSVSFRMVSLPCPVCSPEVTSPLWLGLTEATSKVIAWAGTVLRPTIQRPANRTTLAMAGHFRSENEVAYIDSYLRDRRAKPQFGSESLASHRRDWDFPDTLGGRFYNVPVPSDDKSSSGRW